MAQSQSCGREIRIHRRCWQDAHGGKWVSLSFRPTWQAQTFVSVARADRIPSHAAHVLMPVQDRCDIAILVVGVQVVGSIGRCGLPCRACPATAGARVRLSALTLRSLRCSTLLMGRYLDDKTTSVIAAAPPLHQLRSKGNSGLY